MTATKHQPLAALVLIVVLGIITGLFGSRIFYKRYVQAFERELSQTGIGTPSEIGDSGLWYVFIGLLIGTMAGLAVGLSVYVSLKQRYSEPSPTSIPSPNFFRANCATIFCSCYFNTYNIQTRFHRF